MPAGFTTATVAESADDVGSSPHPATITATATMAWAGRADRSLMDERLRSAEPANTVNGLPEQAHPERLTLD